MSGPRSDTPRTDKLCRDRNFAPWSEPASGGTTLPSALAFHAMQLERELTAKRDPDGYATLLDDKGRAPPYWYVGAYHTRAVAEDVARRGNQGARVVPIYFAPPAGDVIDEIAAERQRQVSAEGWSAAHDDAHRDGSLGAAAASYALPEADRRGKRLRDGDEWWIVPLTWPDSWHPAWWKPKDRRRDLIRAAALIVAEIERMDRNL